MQELALIHPGRNGRWRVPVRIPPQTGAAPPSTEELAASSVFHARLEKALEELPEKLRLVLLLAAIEGYTLEEVAEMLSVPVGTVKSRLFHGRKALAEKLR